MTYDKTRSRGRNRNVLNVALYARSRNRNRNGAFDVIKVRGQRSEPQLEVRLRKVGVEIGMALFRYVSRSSEVGGQE